MKKISYPQWSFEQDYENKLISQKIYWNVFGKKTIIVRQLR